MAKIMPNNDELLFEFWTHPNSDAILLMMLDEDFQFLLQLVFMLFWGSFLKVAFPSFFYIKNRYVYNARWNLNGEKLFLSA